MFAHEVVHSPDEIRVGDVFLNTAGATFVLTRRPDRDGYFSARFFDAPPWGGEVRLHWDTYKCTILSSPDWAKAKTRYHDWSHEGDGSPLSCRRVWADCEAHYGIAHHGSDDPDPRRKLALLALKGDAEALDLMEDAIRLGGRG